MKRLTILSRAGVRLGCGLALSLLLTTELSAADHRDASLPPTLSPMNGIDLNDLFIFRSPANANNTVLIMTVAPFAGQLSPETFDPKLRYQIVIDQDGNNTTDLTLTASFGAPEANNQQTITLTGAARGEQPRTLATGLTETDLPLAGGGMLHAGKRDDPFFFDMIGFLMLADDGLGTFPRTTGAVNFFGPNVNTLAIIIEVPTAALLMDPDRPVILGSLRTLRPDGTQRDRAGLPFANQFLIPPLPRNDTTQRDRRDAFNLSRSALDHRFRGDVVGVLTGFWGNSPGRAGALTDRVLLPAVLTYDTSFTFAAPAAGFPNGRRLTDDVADYMLNQLSNGTIPTDNVADDNGGRITDGSMDASGTPRRVAFPYIGAANP